MPQQVDYKTARGWLFAEEREYLVRIAKETAVRFPSPRIVNIGVEYGASLHCLLAGAPDATIYGVDLNTSKVEPPDLPVELLEGDSTSGDTSRRVRKPVHLLFIDGGHDYTTVYADLSRWAMKVVEGGMVILHDHILDPKHHNWQPPIAEVPPALTDWLDAQPEGAWERVDGPDTLGVVRRRAE